MDKETGEYAHLIRQYILKNYRNNFREPLGSISHPFIVPGACYGHQLWDWDSWLTGVALLDIPDSEMFGYQTGCIINFLEHMDRFGRLPILLEEPITPMGGWFLLDDDKESNIHKPCLVQHALAVARHFNDAEWIRGYYPQIEKYLGWYEKNCRHEETGLYFWINDFAIGFDNDPTVFYRPDKSTGAIYLNSLMYGELAAMAELSDLLGLDDRKKEYFRKAEALRQAIRSECYDRATGYFYSVDLSLRKIDPSVPLHSGCPRSWKSLPIRIVTWAGMMPLYYRIATAEQARSAIENFYLDESTLNSVSGIRSVSKKEKMYAVLKTGNPSCWLGPVWIVANYMTYVGLRNYGYDDLAKELAVKTIRLLGKDLKQCGSFHEYYDPDTGEGVNNEGFQSWNFLVLKMIEDLENEISLDFVKNNVDAAHQVSFAYYTEGDLDNAKTRTMFIGNSITIHEIKPEIGWNRNCGMAASSIDNDYVHLVYRETLRRDSGAAMLVLNGGYWELDYTNESKRKTILDTAGKYPFDTIVMRIGENFNKDYLKDPSKDPFDAFDSLIQGLKGKCRKLIVTDLFWRHPQLNKAIEDACRKNGADFVSITDLGDSDENKAIGLFAHEGVSAHPGDTGMKRIADRIIARL